ncbi:hypothetical protein F4805DRAFT_3892 [Annulohypoxylon moriforme]|nr:hypothetical protein F4805DRAFT_3892 [Annulohypoxylon moriforme]
MQDKQKQTLEDLAESFSDNIDRTEDVARCTNNSSDLNSGYNLRSGDKKLDVVHNFLRFLKPHVGSCHDVSEEVGTGVREYQRKLKRLTQYLAYDGDRNMKDIRRLALPYGIESYHLEKLTGLTKRTEFQNWLREDRVSTRLLIQGHFETSDTPSPLSHLCARFPGEYLRRGQTGIIFLHYFCHIQFNRRGMMANACDIASSFIGQLIHNTQLAPVIDIRFLKPLQMEKIKKQNFEKILELLVKILHQISDENVVIFCFIDSISVYESRPRLRLTLKFFEQLFKFLKPRSSRRRNGASRIIWKLLVTESRRTNYIYKYFKGPGETLNVYE